MKIGGLDSKIKEENIKSEKVSPAKVGKIAKEIYRAWDIDTWVHDIDIETDILAAIEEAYVMGMDKKMVVE